ncbi:hypothetical protein B6V72_09650 [Thioclava sp. F34-6]|uniref:tyrosine-type recombinase/integrase n=1 Tax=Thioclava sp. F34-6 TaxID=1973003 RepID=UPI000B542EC1|nr:site-specific integrase [Thioclava sp. F34-6]OWY13061.1 hypothetical protein B6V72_09650 [Thioclava sp. F34-6]
MKVQLTDTLVRSTQPPEAGRIEISDTIRVGLRLRVSASGGRVWIFEKRVKGGPKRKHTLGTYPELSIKEARNIALVIELEAARGFDRVSEGKKLAAEKKEEDRKAKSIGELLDIFAATHLKNLRSGKEVERVLRFEFADRLTEKAADLTEADLQALIDEKAATGAGVMANRLKAYLTKLSKFAKRRGHIPVDIGSGLESAVREEPRERVLTLEEMKLIWKATYTLSSLTGPLVRLLMLTGQRRTEIAALKWSEINFKRNRILLSGSRMKNGNWHITHLSAAALEELAIRRELSTCEYVFSSTGTTPVSGFTKIKLALLKHLPDDMEPWTFHDFRTSFATHMSERGAAEAVVDRILNHAAAGSAPSAVARIYNRAKHLPERREILDQWAELLTSDCEEDDDKVVPIFRRAMH